MKSNTKPENLRPYISCLGSVSRIDGSKLSDYIPQFIDKLFDYCGKVDDKEKEDEIVYFYFINSLKKLEQNVLLQLID